MRIKSRIVLAGLFLTVTIGRHAGRARMCDRSLFYRCLPEDGCEQVVYLRAWLWMNGVFSMNRASATRRIARIGFAPVLLWLAAEVGIANAQTGAPMERLRSSTLSTLILSARPSGRSFQVDSAGCGKKGGSTAIRNYAHPMSQPHSSRRRADCDPPTEKYHSVKHAVHGAYTR